MAEKRFTLRMSEALFNVAKLCAENNNRSIAKEMELAMARYYLLLPLIDCILDDYKFNISDFEKNENIDEIRDLIIHELEEIKANYKLFSRNKNK